MPNPSIKLLQQQTIDKIAAGEVIERPLSIVKELVENAIDAGADAITVEMKDGGRAFIRITDNGIGIRREDLPLAFVRHATSKISGVNDLFALQTLGFRGEALASIAAVSKVELLTRTMDEPTGFRYVIHGGEEISLEEIGAPNGTSIFVRDLFYNTPARKKFLLSDRIEQGRTQELMEHLALSRPGISFRMIGNNKELLYTSGSGQLKNAIFEIYGKQTTGELLPIDKQYQNLHIQGFIGNSSLSRGNRNMEFIFVNGRWIKDHQLSEALERGYHGYLMQHQFPYAILMLNITEDQVDVNVHPTKMEVRFFDAPFVHDCITRAVSDALHVQEDIVEVILEEPNTQSVLNDHPVIAEPFEEKTLTKIKEHLKEEIKKDTPYNTVYQKEQKERIETYQQQVFLSALAKKQHRMIGQVFGTYWLIEYEQKLYIIDQHAAHEKVLFEDTMQKLKDGNLSSQQISPPIIVTLSAQEEEKLQSIHDTLTSLGFSISNFEGKEYAINAVPLDYSNVSPRALFLDILSTYTQKNETPKMLMERVASISCKAAVKGNHAMSSGEMDALLDHLLTLENPYHCPHGRPTMISFSQNELDKKFRRIL